MTAGVRSQMVLNIAKRVGPIMAEECIKSYPNKTPEERARILLTDKSCERLFSAYECSSGYEELANKIKENVKNGRCGRP